jgi:hypothetical protein
MPTPDRSSSLTAVAAAPGPRSESPKHNYTEAMTIPSRLPLLELELELDVSEIDIASDVYCFSGAKCNSPRSRVAERLEALDIDQAEDGPRKRVKTAFVEPEYASKVTTRFDVTPKQSPRPRLNLAQHKPAAVLEIAETPGCRPEMPRPEMPRPEMPRPSTPSPLAKQISPSKTKSNSPFVKITPKRMRSPPPPLTTSPTPSDKPATSSTSSQDSSNLATTTWQESEITGHEIHTALGDDGEGINGIGFRPTPAIAQARSQKRKHQLNQWRAREAKEARQRRYERRQGCAVDAGGRNEGQRRAVRFEEIG